MSASDSFKKHALAAAERLWLSEAAQTGFSERTAKVALHGRLPEGFDPDLIDRRIYAFNRITPVGLWLLDPKHPLLQAIHGTIQDIKRRILADSTVSRITVLQIAESTGLAPSVVGRVLCMLGDIDNYYSSARRAGAGGGEVLEEISLTDRRSFDNYLSYQSLDDFLERTYTRRGKALYGSILESQPQIRSAKQTAKEKSRAGSSRPSEKDATRSETLIERLQNHRVLSVVIAIGIVVIAIGAFTEALVNIKDAIVGAVGADRPVQQIEPPHADSDGFQTVKVTPSWDANNVHWPMIPAEQEAFQAKQQAVMNECGFCISMTDHSLRAEDGVLNRAGSYVEFDARKCERIVRLAMKAFRLRNAIGVPPAISAVFNSVDLNPGMITQISTAEITTFSAAPVECLK